MSDAVKQATAPVDADLVAAQFERLDRATHHAALLEALRSRDAYRKLIDELQAKIAKLEQGLIGPKSQRFKVEDGDPQLSLQILAVLGAAQVSRQDGRSRASSQGRTRFT